jgi:hypothetical protein
MSGAFDIMRMAVVPSTAAGYDRAGLYFQQWLGAPRRVQDLTIAQVLNYLAGLFDDGWSFAEANKFQFWLAHEEIAATGRRRLAADARLHRLLSGYRKAWAGCCKVTEPLRYEQLKALLALGKLRAPAQHMAVLAYVCLLRYGEAVDVMTGYSRLERVAKGWLLHLARSKCDVLRRGVTVLFRRADVPPALCQYLDRIVEPGQHWDLPSRSAWRRWLTTILPGSHFHGFRHGRVMDLIADGMSKEDIMHSGRWKSLGGFGTYQGHV